jgi:uncharacterized membrane protein YagU involved in acid resistance
MSAMWPATTIKFSYQEDTHMRPDWKRAIVGGFVGTLALTFMIYQVAPKMGVKMDIAGQLGQMFGSWTMGLVVHFILGTVVFSLSYALLAYRFLPGPPVVKGLVWGVVLWLGLQLVGMPMMGAGVFGTKAGGMKAVISALVAHLVYGALLGSIAGASVGSARQERQVRRAA